MYVYGKYSRIGSQQRRNYCMVFKATLARSNATWREIFLMRYLVWDEMVDIIDIDML